MRCDPERTATLLLSGQCGTRRRRRLQQHLLGCDRCWREVAAARRGRALAESTRTLAPAGLRDRIRATTDLPPATAATRRVPRLALTAAAIILTLAAGLLAARAMTDTGDAGQPDQITALIAAYRNGQAGWQPSTAQAPVGTVPGMSWTGARQATINGQPLVAHLYIATTGERVLLVRSTVDFPRVPAAHDLADGDWAALDQGVTLRCTSRPAPTLILGDDAGAVTALADAARR